jgi:hypothetical protein
VHGVQKVDPTPMLGFTTALLLVKLQMPGAWAHIALNTRVIFVAYWLAELGKQPW